MSRFLYERTERPVRRAALARRPDARAPGLSPAGITPADLIVLQRSVGNRAVSAAVRELAEQRDAPWRAPMPWRRISVTDPTRSRGFKIGSHRALEADAETFRKGLERHGMSATRIALVWKLIVRGLRAKKLGNKSVSDYSFDEAAEALHGLLGLQKGQKMALWSGGIGVSRYAEGKGFTTLEGSKAGRFIDSLLVCKELAASGDFWDKIAAKFVESARGEVHVFVRFFDPKSTLFSVEIPRLQTLIPQITIKWHVLIGKDEAIKELNDDGKLVNNASFEDQGVAYLVHREYVKRHLRGTPMAIRMGIPDTE